MFSLLLTHGRQIVAARLNDLRHREPFVRLLPLGTLPRRRCFSTLKAFEPCLVDRRISTAVNELLPRGLTTRWCLRQRDIRALKVGGHGARSGDLEPQQGPLPPYSSQTVQGTVRNSEVSITAARLSFANQSLLSSLFRRQERTCRAAAHNHK